MTTPKLKVALIGCGKMGLHHAKAIEIQKNAEVVAVADPAVDAGKLEEVVGRKVDVYDDARTMLEKAKPDVVHIVTPHNTHVELAKLALEHGANVYVEKPFALNAKDARDIIALANEKGLKACAAHQVLFQDSGRKYREYMHLIGSVIHVESYFSFKTVRRAGSGLMSPVEQLEDILPHPVYLLLSALEPSTNERGEAGGYELHSFEVDPAGEVRAIIKQGDALALLIVTLRGRPIESYLRIVGTNGSLNADFVLSGVTKILGPGASAIAAVLQPFSEARQKVFGTIATIFKMVFKRQKSYSGLAELIEAFYGSIVRNSELPMTYDSIIQTVEICEQIGDRLREADAIAEKAAQERLAKAEQALEPADLDKGVVLVTGGTGFLGRELVKELRDRKWAVRVIARKLPSAAKRVPGVEYVHGDIAQEIPDDYFKDVAVVAHLAAETAGGKDEHDRNTVGATRYVAEGAARNKVKQFINISSIAVHKPSNVIGGPISEESPIDFDNLGRGPYVWAKAEAEKIVAELCDKNNIAHKTIRLGPLVDFQHFTPPGRLGREVGTLYVAMGSGRSELSVCDVQTASNVIRYYVEDFEQAPASLNLVESPPPTRKELVKKLRKARPELRVMWLPVPVLKTLSYMLKGALKLKSPSKKPLDLYAAFASEKYNTQLAGEVINKARKQH